jgi:hypothetical protein
MPEQTAPEVDTQVPAWGADAPRGGKAVLNRIIKEKATVPLFFGQTLISSLRDVGYNSTTSALCEHVDNAIQWGATEVRVYFRQTGKKGTYQTSESPQSLRGMCRPVNHGWRWIDSSIPHVA